MGSTFFCLLVFGLDVTLSAMGDKYLKSRDSDTDVIYSGLTDDEKKAVMSLDGELADSLLENNALLKREREENTLNNCQCSTNDASCICLLQLSLIHMKIMYAVGYKPTERSIVMILTIDGNIIVEDEIKIPAKEAYKSACMPLPPPTYWMAGCLEMKITDEQQGFTICGTVDLEITAQGRSKPICSMDLTCFVHEEGSGADRLALKHRSADEENEEIENIRVVKGFEAATREYNKLKMARIRSSSDDDSLDEPFWNLIDKHEPPEERSDEPAKGLEMVNWWLLGTDEVPYQTILFKGFVTPQLQSAQGLENFQMISNAIKESIAQKNGYWHQKVVPNVFEPGNSCGGALLSVNKVLTLCACIRSFYHQNKHKKPAPGKGSKYDIKVDEGTSTNIYLEFSGTRFTGKQYHHLDRNAENYDTKSSCFKLIDSGEDGQQATMVVMPITPKIPTRNPYYYVLWPPFPIHEKYKQNPIGNLVTFGTQSKESISITDQSGRVIDPKMKAVSILLKRDKMNDYCIKETFEKPSIPEPFKKKTTCFHARENQICNGLVGSPITRGDDLAGLAASPIDCAGTDNSVMGAVFDDEIVKEIETYLGKGLKTRRFAAHSYLYREPDHIVHVISDYTTSDETPKPAPDSSRATRGACSSCLISFLLICQIHVLIK